MTQNWPQKDPDQLGEFVWDIPLAADEAVTGSPDIRVLTGGLVVAGVPVVSAGILTVHFLGGTSGTDAVVQISVATDRPGTIAETFIMPISSPARALSRTERLIEDIDVLEDALMNLASGKQVKETWRNGRRIIVNHMTADQINATIDRKRRQLADAEAATTGRRARRPLRIGMMD